MKQRLAFLICLLVQPVWSASRGVILPGSGPALVLVEEVNSSSGELDSDPYLLSDDMQVPWQSNGQGDRAKILEDEFLKLICIERAATLRHQCQFILKHSPHSRIDPLSKTIQYKINGEQATSVWMQRMGEDRLSYQFLSTDKKLKWNISATEMSFSFAE